MVILLIIGSISEIAIGLTSTTHLSVPKAAIPLARSHDKARVDAWRAL